MVYARERRKTHPAILSLIVMIALQIIGLSYFFGNIAGTLAAHGQRLDRIERKLDQILKP